MTHQPSDTVSPPTRQRTLLYVEDNEANLALVEQLIARRGEVRLLLARTGYTGIGLAHSERPDAILMDINLPDIDGLTVLKILRENPVTAHIPVVALSSDDYPPSITAGFFRYMTKPFRIDELMAALEASFELAEQQAKTYPPGA